MSFDPPIDDTNSFMHCHSWPNDYDVVECPICDDALVYSDTDWHRPHPAGSEIPDWEAYVCSELCADLWMIKHRELVAEWEREHVLQEAKQ